MCGPVVCVGGEGVDEDTPPVMGDQQRSISSALALSAMGESLVVLCAVCTPPSRGFPLRVSAVIQAQPTTETEEGENPDVPLKADRFDVRYCLMPHVAILGTIYVGRQLGSCTERIYICTPLGRRQWCPGILLKKNMVFNVDYMSK